LDFRKTIPERWMQVGEERFNGDDIRRLYESASYQRRRRLRELQQVVKMKASANVGSPAVRNHLSAIHGDM
jgi:hypothetical protein